MRAHFQKERDKKICKKEKSKIVANASKLNLLVSCVKDMNVTRFYDPPCPREARGELRLEVERIGEIMRLPFGNFDAQVCRAIALVSNIEKGRLIIA